MSSPEHPRLVIVRGHPGSGKSTLARKIVEMADFTHHENDVFFTSEGTYSYDASRHAEAKAWCLSSVEEALEQGRDAVVSNTFTTLSEIQPYLDLGRPTTVVEMHLDHPNDHGVPDEVVAAKKVAFEPYDHAVSIIDVAAADAFVSLFARRGAWLAPGR
jgi:adenylate kinase family enzyme